jgi:hypothetical protein
MAASTNWVSYYRANRQDGGTIESLYAFDDEELADISKGHNNDVSALRTTIANSGGGNFILAPGSKGTVNFLHQGFVTTHQLGGATILAFIQGNFSSSPFKVLGRPADFVIPIDHGKAATRGTAAPTACPTLASIFAASDENAFVALPGEVGTLTLENRPNHLFVHPRIFTRADGPKTMRSKTLAWAIIKQMNEELTNAGTDQEKADVQEEQENVGVLLAFLWASERGLLTPVTLSDMEESPHLNHQCELIVDKIRTPTTPKAGGPLDTASGLAVATHNLMLSMQKTETTRIKERAEDKSAKSLIRNLSPRQQDLFTRLCTTHMHRAPKMPEFLIQCLAEKAPHRTANLLAHESRNWKGTFSAAGLSRFLAGGYLSQEGGHGEPGGFTAFMFHPKSPSTKGTSTESAIKGKGRIREFFDLDADEETIKFYQKKEFFVPTSEPELKIVLQTWHDLLVLLTVKDTIAAEGLSLILEKYDSYYQVIQEMFASSKDFGLTVLVILDNHLQRFFEMVSEMDDMSKATARQRDFLWLQASDFLAGLDNRQPPSVVIPQCLRSTPSGIKNVPGITATADNDDPSPSKKRRLAKKAKREQGASNVTNKEPQQAWSIPEGKAYDDFFKTEGGGVNDLNWPKMADARHDWDKRMCVRFQVKGKCTSQCSLAHTLKSKMSSQQGKAVTDRFKKIFGN